MIDRFGDLDWKTIIEHMQVRSIETTGNFFDLPFRLTEKLRWLGRMVSVDLSLQWKEDYAASRLLAPPITQMDRVKDDHSVLARWFTKIAWRQRVGQDGPRSMLLICDPDTGELLEFSIHLLRPGVEEVLRYEGTYSN